MKWKSAKKLSSESFKRLIGVKKDTYLEMVKTARSIAKQQPRKVKGKKRGPKEKLSWYDKTLMLMMYYREYRTYSHIGADYGISETQCWRIITTMERWLLQSDLFHLPGRKKLMESDVEWEVVIVDVSEHPIERPKKNSDNIIQGRKRSIP